MRIQWTGPATQDLVAICDYTEQRLGRAQARQTALRISARVASLEQFPHLGRPGRKRDTRELILSGLPFLAVYRVREDVVEVVRILHGAQRWP